MRFLYIGLMIFLTSSLYSKNSDVNTTISKNDTNKTVIKEEYDWNKSMIINFYMGYEGSTYNSLKSHDGARSSLLIYTRPIKRKIDGFGFSGVDIFGNIIYSNATKDDTVSPHLEMDTNIFLPFYSSNFPDLKGKNFRLGILTNASIGVDDNSTNFTKKFNFGLRMANSEDTFFDIFLIDKIEGMDSDKRVEFRGQVNVGEILDGDIFLGGVANFDYKNETQDDTLRIYVLWSKPLKDLSILENK